MMIALQDVCTKGLTLDISQTLMASNLVKQIQIRLKAVGLPVGEADGQWGKLTAYGFNRFCAVYNQPPGKLTPHVAKSLIECKTLPFLAADDSTFEIALGLCLKYEGGFSDDPNDEGGETNYGITHGEYDHWRQFQGKPTQSVRDISIDEVRAIYKAQYWNTAYCFKLADRTAIAVFDWSVNSGTTEGLETLQQCLGLIGDGVFGPQTELSFRRVISSGGETQLVKDYMQSRAATYRRWGAGSQECFLEGWLARCDDLSKFLGV